MVNITIYPYGNANERQLSNGSWSFTCQHGEDECQGNLVETCFINLVSFDQDKFMDFIITYEADLEKSSKNPYSTAQTLLSTGNYAVTWVDFIITYEADLEKSSKNPYSTAQTLLSTGNYAVTWAQMDSCLTSTQGNTWEHQMAVWTNAANHQYTPWITLNGKHTNTIQNECSASTLECTCAQYSGTNSCCKKFAEEPMDEVCWKDSN
eukprot:CAMPEP_0197072196 /NCGR_PEP_ID=MMETSP1384-20130603/209975_1 /TAXON_ID=29189 /ORGANISM="Ammonia sp." /LENGTH=207 /DNA_ID=CAMNT_0042511013 /DNA_START=204 /DNA_END=827 /DNA_ORIENTATION=+